MSSWWRSRVPLPHPPLTVRSLGTSSTVFKMADEADEVDTRGLERPLVEDYSDEDEEETR